VFFFLLLPSQGLQQGEESIPMFQGSNLFAELLETLSIPHAQDASTQWQGYMTCLWSNWN
jgi:hypothetical protein